MTRAPFITFEGGEGVGKTTQIKYLAENLKAKGHDVVTTREPGGCPVAEDIRSLIFDPKYDGEWTVSAETLMMFAARSMHIKDVIKPALQNKKAVLCDRYMDSTRVYQGNVKGVDADFIKALEAQIIGDVIPDLTIIMDLPADIAMARVQARGAESYHDRGPIHFYENLRQGFLELAKQNPERCVIIDASQDKEAIATQILGVVEDRIK